MNEMATESEVLAGRICVFAYVLVCGFVCVFMCLCVYLLVCWYANFFFIQLCK